MVRTRKTNNIPKSIYIPKNFRLGKSTINGAGLGIFTKVDLPKGAYLSTYKGKELTPKEYYQSPKELDYVWEILDTNGKPLKYIDAGVIRNSNFLRYINHPLNKKMQNVRAVQVGENIIYETSKRVKKGDELLVNYGPQYSKFLLGKVV